MTQGLSAFYLSPPQPFTRSSTRAMLGRLGISSRASELVHHDVRVILSVRKVDFLKLRIVGGFLHNVIYNIIYLIYIYIIYIFVFVYYDWYDGMPGILAQYIRTLGPLGAFASIIGASVPGHFHNNNGRTKQQTKETWQGYSIEN